MAYNPVTACQFEAVAVAMRARAGQLEQLDVMQLQTRAEQLLEDHASPTFRAISAFATQYELHRRDAPAVAELGEDLLRSIELAARPDPVDAARVDIHG